MSHLLPLLLACAFVLVRGRHGASAIPFYARSIPLYARDLGCTLGYELEPISDQSKSAYEGQDVCVVSAHGQRSAGCSRCPQRLSLEHALEDAAKRHPLRANV
mmetsp:Transcript_13496/g.46988  ORF Transcript_13496/g.46988 Transcript_13496/m.46988 type:complete len:103 (+) Transcript_13496:70-378(+)